jgi:hypothetical protein
MNQLTNHSIPEPTSVATMTSLELVKFINSERAEGETELRHSDFLTKVPKVLGEIGERNFRFTYTDVQNKERPCYNFPKREACLMAMSYSYELQAKVYDKMTALEEGSFSVPKTLAGALRLAADQQDVIVEQARKLLLLHLRWLILRTSLKLMVSSVFVKLLKL